MAPDDMHQDTHTPQDLVARYKIRQVTDYQASWVQQERGAPGQFAVQLILDKGVAEHILEVDADDLDVLLELLGTSDHVMWDAERKILMFENIKVHKD